MRELTKKVVILNNFASPYVSQAIIVLRDCNPKLEGKAVEDAELIVTRYIERMKKNGQPRMAARKKGKILEFLSKLSRHVFFTAAVFAVLYFTGLLKF